MNNGLRASVYATIAMATVGAHSLMQQTMAKGEEHQSDPIGYSNPKDPLLPQGLPKYYLEDYVRFNDGSCGYIVSEGRWNDDHHDYYYRVYFPTAAYYHYWSLPEKGLTRIPVNPEAPILDETKIPVMSR